MDSHAGRCGTRAAPSPAATPAPPYAQAAQQLGCFDAAYPIMSSHTAFRAQSLLGQTAVMGYRPREYERTPRQIEYIRRSGGIIAPAVGQDPARSIGAAPDPKETPEWRLDARRDQISQFNPSLVANNCAGSDKGWMQAFLYGAAKMQADPANVGGPAGGVALGTDMTMVGGPGPRFNTPRPEGPTSCTAGYAADNRVAEEAFNPGLYARAAQANPVQYVLPNQNPAGSQIRGLVRPGSPMTAGGMIDFNTVGLQTYGLLPDFIQDAKNAGIGNKAIEALFNSADRYIRMWDKAYVITGCVGGARARCAQQPTVVLPHAATCRNTCPDDPGRGMDRRPDGLPYAFK